MWIYAPDADLLTNPDTNGTIRLIETPSLPGLKGRRWMLLIGAAAIDFKTEEAAREAFSDILGFLRDVYDVRRLDIDKACIEKNGPMHGWVSEGKGEEDWRKRAADLGVAPGDKTP